MTVVDINCDVGEGVGNEAELMPYLSSCSIACGGHAGDKETIINTIQLALQHTVKIGAHPSFPDRENFGRKILEMPLVTLQMSLEQQINTILTNVSKLKGTLHHIKAHGALYNLSAIQNEYAQIVINAVKNTHPTAFLYVPYNSILQRMAVQQGLKIKVEAFADRNYHNDLTLVSRKESNALITDVTVLVEHLLKMIVKKRVLSVEGIEVKIEADTFCIHGDNFNAKNLLKEMHKKLLENKIKVV